MADYETVDLDKEMWENIAKERKELLELKKKVDREKDKAPKHE